MSWEHIINAASAAWKVIEDGAPSSEISSNTANAVPEVDDWSALVGAQSTKLTWTYVRTNALGLFTAVDVKFELFWEWGATYRNGGAFIPNIWISVPTCDLTWGQNMDIDLVTRNPTNRNTSDPRRPIAHIPVTVRGTHTNVLESNHIEWNFVLEGDGAWQQL
jgi:hypothetical protein